MLATANTEAVEAIGFDIAQSWAFAYLQEQERNLSNQSHCTTVLQCTFENNTAGTGGGAVYVLFDNLQIEDCEFNNNSAADRGALAPAINEIALSTGDAITLANSMVETNKLKLTITKSIGVIIGSFGNRNRSKRPIKITGAILQNQTNAQGHFLGTNSRGIFTLDRP